MPAPSRTLKGKIAAHRFQPEPLIWVEGPTDIPVFRRFLGEVDCVLKEAGGKEECLKLVEAILENDHPYVVIIDGDYECLTRQRSPHRRVVILHRYSSENYLIERKPVDAVARDFSREDADWICRPYDDWLEEFEKSFRKLVELDAALFLAGKNQRIVPEKVDRLLKGKSIAMNLDLNETEKRCARAEKSLTPDQIDEGRTIVAAYLEEHRLIDLVRGHCAFGALRYFLFGKIRGRGCSIQCSDDILRSMLASEIWGKNLSADHRSLERRLRHAIRDVRNTRARTIGSS